MSSKVPTAEGVPSAELAERYGTTVDAFLKANPQIRDPDLIFTGDTLVVPTARDQQPAGGSTYRIERGDTLSGLAQRFGTVGGFGLMYPTVAVEGSDSFDAISRSFSYVFARPWRSQSPSSPRSGCVIRASEVDPSRRLRPPAVLEREAITPPSPPAVSWQVQVSPLQLTFKLLVGNTLHWLLSKLGAQ